MVRPLDSLGLISIIYFHAANRNPSLLGMTLVELLIPPESDGRFSCARPTGELPHLFKRHLVKKPIVGQKQFSWVLRYGTKLSSRASLSQQSISLMTGDRMT